MSTRGGLFEEDPDKNVAIVNFLDELKKKSEQEEENFRFFSFKPARVGSEKKVNYF